MKVAVLGGGPAGLYFSLLMKKADPATRSPCSSATRRTTRSAGAWSSRTRRSATSRPPTPRRSRRSPTTSPTGTTSTSTQGADDHLRRPRLRGIARMQAARDPAAPRAPSSASTSASASRSTTTRPRRLGLADADLDRRGRRGEQRGPARARASTFRARRRRAASAVRLARHHPAVRRLHLHLRRERARHLPGPRLPVQRPALGVHRRVRRAVLAQRRASTAWTSTARIAACERCSPPGSTATRSWPTSRPPARRAVAPLPARPLRTAGGTTTSC